MYLLFPTAIMSNNEIILVIINIGQDALVSPIINRNKDTIAVQTKR